MASSCNVYRVAKNDGGGFEQAGVVSGELDNGTIAAWDNRQCDNGPMINETTDIETVDTEQLPMLV